MECKRSIHGSWNMVILLLMIGCARDGAGEPTPVADEAAVETTVIVPVAAQVTDSQVVQASAAVSDAADVDEEEVLGTVDAGVSLRDANVATSLIARTFPIRDMFVKYSGALISPYHSGVGHIPSPEASQWVLDRVEWDGTVRSEVVFELLNSSKSEHDIPLHVEIDRVVYIHVRYCRSDEQGVVPNDEFEIDGVGIFELFQQCADRVKQHWEAERRFAEANKDAQSVYHLKENLLQNAERRGAWNVFPMDDNGVFFTEDPSQIRRPPWASE